MNFGNYLSRGPSVPKANGYTSTGIFNTGSTSNDSSSSPIKRIMAYVLAIVIIIFVIF